MVKLVIGLLGENGGGKTTLANFLVDKHGAFTISSGQLVRDELMAEGVAKPTREACQIRGGERGREDKTYWVKKIISAMEASGADIYIFDGTRFPHDVTLLREHFGGHYIAIYITADQGARYERSLARGRGDAPKTFEEFVAQDEGEREQFDLEATIGMKDETFDNNPTYDLETPEGQESLYERFIDSMPRIKAAID